MNAYLLEIWRARTTFTCTVLRSADWSATLKRGRQRRQSRKHRLTLPWKNTDVHDTAHAQTSTNERSGQQETPRARTVDTVKEKNTNLVVFKKGASSFFFSLRVCLCVSLLLWLFHFSLSQRDTTHTKALITPCSDRERWCPSHKKKSTMEIQTKAEWKKKKKLDMRGWERQRSTRSQSKNLTCRAHE